MSTVHLACQAMATRFEFVLHGPDEARTRAAGEEALDEVRRIEAALNLYQPDSEIAEANRNAAHRPVRLSPEVFRLLQHAQLLSQTTDGAFDITAAPLLRTWGLMRGTGRVPSEAERKEAHACVGYDGFVLNEAELTVRFVRPGVILDLGAIGKGYALDRAAEILRENGIANALLHGGTSSAIALGCPPADVADSWRIAIGRPDPAALGRTSLPVPGRDLDPSSSEEGEAPVAIVELRDESFAVSAVWGKGFAADGRFYGHVLDPRTGYPADQALLAAVALPSATESDALSTALLVRGGEMMERLRESAAPGRYLVLERSPEAPGYRAIAKGISATVL